MDLHTERQSVAAWVHLVMIACVLPGTVAAILAEDPGARWTIAICVVIIVAVYGLFTPMTVRVDSERVAVDFGRFGWPRWRFPISEISSAETVEFAPLRDFGGWGIRRGKKGWCLNQRGSRGVRMDFAGRSYIIGSDDPEALLRAMQTAGVPRG